MDVSSLAPAQLFHDWDEVENHYLLHEPSLKIDGRYSELVAALLPGSDQGDDYRYNPTLLTIAAGSESKCYDRGRPWQTHRLSWLGLEPAYYTHPVPAHIRWSRPDQKKVFIIFGSSYSTWSRGTWTNQIAHHLIEEFDTPHLIAFGGFLTPEFLRLQPLSPSITTQEPAHDLYLRLQTAIRDWKSSGRIPKDAQIGLIGFSGGASLCIHLLSEDQRQQEAASGNGCLLFEQGAIAFSPVLDLSTSFEVLDGANHALDKRGFPSGRALTRPIFPDYFRAILQGYSTTDCRPFLRLTDSRNPLYRSGRREDLVGRFYREFQSVDLVSTSEAYYPSTPELRQRARTHRRTTSLTHRQYYRELVFTHDKCRRALSDTQVFEDCTHLGAELSALRTAPLYVVFPQDDPVLASIDPEILPNANCALPARLKTILDQARAVPSIRVFAPTHGAHMGYFLDTQYLRSALRRFFNATPTLTR